jgi:putative ABC transport system permease protein
MNLFFIAWKNITHRPASVILSLILFALGVGLVGFLSQVDRQIQQKFENNLAGIDLVVGAKGSPLQLVLSSMYHIDAPTGNISLKSARPFLREGHPLIDVAIPLSMGDSYKGFRIVGTTGDILGLYDVDGSEELLWQYPFDATVGASVAEALKLDIGDRFQSSHGFTDDIHSHDQELEVVGVLPPTNTVLDQLILTSPATYWQMHNSHSDSNSRDKGAKDSLEQADAHDHTGEHDHDQSGDHDHDHSGEHDHDHTGEHDHDHTGEHDHDHTGEHDHDQSREHLDAEEHDEAGSESNTPSTATIDYLLSQPEDLSITSLLLQFKGRNFQALNLGRNINENTDMQAASPAIEINRLFSLLDSATAAIRALALAIVLVSAISIFLALYNKLRSRKFELAYMRVKGASRTKVFLLILWEGIIIAILGTIAGLAMSYSGLYLLSLNLENNYNYSLSNLQFTVAELWIVIAALGIGVLAALIPAIQASRTDISLLLRKVDQNE